MINKTQIINNIKTLLRVKKNFRVKGFEGLEKEFPEIKVKKLGSYYYFTK